VPDKYVSPFLTMDKQTAVNELLKERIREKLGELRKAKGIKKKVTRTTRNKASAEIDIGENSFDAEPRDLTL